MINNNAPQYFTTRCFLTAIYYPQQPLCQVLLSPTIGGMRSVMSSMVLNVVVAPLPSAGSPARQICIVFPDTTSSWTVSRAPPRWPSTPSFFTREGIAATPWNLRSYGCRRNSTSAILMVHHSFFSTSTTYYHWLLESGTDVSPPSSGATMPPRLPGARSS